MPTEHSEKREFSSKNFNRLCFFTDYYNRIVLAGFSQGRKYMPFFFSKAGYILPDYLQKLSNAPGRLVLHSKRLKKTACQSSILSTDCV
jgi:hypothetical protein